MRDSLKLKKQQRKRSKQNSATIDGNAAVALDVGEWIPTVRPKYVKPKHLAPLLFELNRAAKGEEIRLTGSVPPRHGKTDTLIAALVHRLKFKPGSRVGYFSYSDNFAAARSREARRLAASIGLRSVEKRAPGVDDDELANTVHYWETNNGGSFLAAGRRGAAIGYGLDLIVIDDPFKGEREARSEAVRQEVWEWFTGTILQRLEPGGSIIIIHTRWNDDDLIGRLMDPNEPAGEDFVHVNLTAIAANDNDPLGRAVGEALWPERFDAKALAKKKREVGEHGWWAQYMGTPRPVGERLFHDPARYEPFDPNTGLNGWTIGIGIDPAGTAKTSSDNTAVAVIAYKWDKERDALLVRLLRVYTFKVEIPDVTGFLEVLQRKWSGAPFALEVTGPGLAVYQTLLRIAPTLNLIPITSTQDKFLRAQPTAAVWNDARAEVPLQENISYDSPEIVKKLTELGVYKQEWIAEYIKRMGRFTGDDGGKDDEVDATVHIVNYAIDTCSPANDSPGKMKERQGRRLGGF